MEHLYTNNSILSNSNGDRHFYIAEKLVRKFTIDCFDKEKYQEAFDEFIKAANSYKVAKNWYKAVECYDRCIFLQKKLKNKDDESQIWIEMAKVTQNIDHLKAIKILKEKCIPYLIENGKFIHVAKHFQEIGDLFELDDDINESIICYKNALQYFEADQFSNSAKINTLTKLANLSVKINNYDDAIIYYELIATNHLEKITKQSAKENYFNSLLCQLAKNDIVQAKQSYEKYIELDYTFEGSPLGKLFEKILRDVENINSNDLSLHLKEYDSYSRLDNVRVPLLLKIKQNINQSEIGENLL